jgi:hypothetical protein
VGDPSEMADHLEKLTDGAIRRATAAIWWKKGAPSRNGAARRGGGDLVGVRDAMGDVGGEWYHLADRDDPRHFLV